MQTSTQTRLRSIIIATGELLFLVAFGAALALGALVLTDPNYTHQSTMTDYEMTK